MLTVPRLFVAAAMATLFFALPVAAFAQVPVPELRLLPMQRLDMNAVAMGEMGWVLPGRGVVAVAEPRLGKVHFFGSDGAVKGQFGRRGQGPGEFSGSRTTAGWVGDSLWVFDANQERLTVVTSGFAVARMTRIQSSVPALGATPVVSEVLAVFPGGDILLRASPEPLRPAPREDSRRERLLRVSGDFSVVREITALPRDEWIVHGTPPPHTPAPLLAVSPDGGRIAIAVTSVEGPKAGTYSVTVLRSTGDTIFSREYPFPMIPLPRSVVAPLITEAALGALYGIAGREASRVMRVPPVYEPLRAIKIGSDGSIWLRVRQSADAFQWLVIDWNGVSIGKADIPNLLTGTVGTAWVGERDANGTPVIAVYQLLPRR